MERRFLAACGVHMHITSSLFLDSSISVSTGTFIVMSVRTLSVAILVTSGWLRYCAALQ